MAAGFSVRLDPVRRAQFHGFLIHQVAGFGVRRDVDAAEFGRLVDSEAHGDVEDLGDDPGDREGVGKRGRRCDRLDAEQAKPDQQGSDNAADEVNADDVDRIVEPEPELQFDGQGTDGPAISPMASAPSGLTAPQAGVMATRAEMSPEAAPMLLALPNLTRSTSAQTRRPAAPATSVFRKTTDAECPAVRAEPALKPNQPAHSSPAPTSTSGRL